MTTTTLTCDGCRRRVSRDDAPRFLRRFGSSDLCGKCQRRVIEGAISGSTIPWMPRCECGGKGYQVVSFGETRDCEECMVTDGWLREPDSRGYWWVLYPNGQRTVAEVLSGTADSLPAQVIGDSTYLLIKPRNPFDQPDLKGCLWKRIEDPELPAA